MPVTTQTLHFIFSAVFFLAVYVKFFAFRFSFFSLLSVLSVSVPGVIVMMANDDEMSISLEIKFISFCSLGNYLNVNTHAHAHRQTYIEDDNTVKKCSNVICSLKIERFFDKAQCKTQ